MSCNERQQNPCFWTICWLWGFWKRMPHIFYLIGWISYSSGQLPWKECIGQDLVHLHDLFPLWSSDRSWQLYLRLANLKLIEIDRAPHPCLRPVVNWEVAASFMSGCIHVWFIMICYPHRKSSSKSVSQVQHQATEAMADQAYTIPMFRQRWVSLVTASQLPYVRLFWV